MIALLAVMLLVQDKADADRVKVANLFEQAFKAQNLPRKMEKGPIHVKGMIVEDGDLRTFAVKYGPERGAVLAASSSGTLWALAGGTSGEEGVPVAFFGNREGILLVAGGPHKNSPGLAEALAGSSRGGSISIGDNRVTRVARGANLRRTPTGGEAPAPAEELSIKGVETLGKDLESMAAEWARATRDDRRDLAAKLAAAHRPTAGVLACVANEGKFLVMIGADGTDTRPDGACVQVAGQTGATVVVLIPGRSKGQGKPGTAKGEGAFIIVE